jgi:hypothetical protein
MNIPASNTTKPSSNISSDILIPLQLFASRYAYAALLDAEGNEQVITDLMIRSACESVTDTPYSFLNCRSLLTA